jgi:hypothetical protein
MNAQATQAVPAMPQMKKVVNDHAIPGELDESNIIG